MGPMSRFSSFKVELKLGLMVLLSILGSAIPFLFAAPIVRVVYRSYSKVSFWAAYSFGTILLVAGGFVPVAISLMSVTLLIGIFSQVFEKYKSMFVAGFVALAVSSVTTVSATQQWLVYKGTSLSVRLHEQVQLVLKQAQQVNSLVKMDPDQLVGQAFSVLVALLIMSLALALILEQPVSRLLKFTSENTERPQLMNFKLPDSYIWIAMVSFLFSFVDIGNKNFSMVATNIVNIMVVLYFFQGLAVIESFFTALKFGFFVRFMTYVVFLIQLFFLVAAIGVIDFWVEFRRRFIRIRLNP
jgi:hypothetical protein